MNYNSNGIREQRRLGEKVDRLSSLPDPILTDILSLLSIEEAAATSVLSHRWRYLWTGVTRLETFPDDFTIVTTSILWQLTSRKLCIVDVTFPGHQDNSFLREICRRNVEELSINAGDQERYEFTVPGFLLNHQPLVCLELYGILKFELPENGVIQLPNLKKLLLNDLSVVPPWLGTLFRYCPLLEYLDLMFQLDTPQPLSFLNIYGLNLKTLKVKTHSIETEIQCTKFSIDAPKLENLEIHDYCASIYSFVKVPPTLVKVYVDLNEDDSGDAVNLTEAEDFLGQMSKFIRGMSSVRNFVLELRQSQYTNIFKHSNSADDRVPLIFCNLSLLEIKLDSIDLNGWKDLLLSLNSFPNLKHLKVDLNCDVDLSKEQMNWCAPKSLPDCVVNKISTIHIRGLHGTDNHLKLLGCILRNAAVLNEFHINIGITNKTGEGQLWMERLFCFKLFKLPKSSLACEVVFTGKYIKQSSAGWTMLY